MLRKALKLAVLFGVGMLAGALSAQTTTTYTGTIKDLSQNLVTSGQVTFTLTPATDSTILGTSRFTPSTIVCTIQANGTILNQSSAGPCVVTQNTSLMPSGTSYKICIQPGYITPGSCFYDYAVGTTRDISTPLPTLGTGLLNYQGPAGPVGPQGPAGPTGPSGGVNSVFGRTGAIVATNGDYSCSQITGAVCSIGTLYYQTVQAAGVSQTQRPKLNLIAGTSTTLTCADNPGNSSTDCTVNATGVIPGTLHDVSGSRAFGTTYQNTAAWMIYVSGYATTNGSAWSSMACVIGPASPTITVFQAQYGATTSGQGAAFTCMVPAGYFYEIVAGGSAVNTLAKWIETDVH